MTFHYPGTHNGVEGFGYTFAPGKKYLLTGASGGGRSTVAQLVAGLYRCEAGTVEYPCTLHSAHEVLYVPQQAHVFQDTLRNNLALGEDFTEDAMHEALRACCLTEFLAGLPNGLDEVLRDRYACSGGEAARLGLARAILRRPKILICDEVTAHLDGATAQQIDALLTSLPGVLLLNVSHKISEAAAGRYDEVLRLENGRLVESGPPPGRGLTAQRKGPALETAAYTVYTVDTGGDNRELGLSVVNKTWRRVTVDERKSSGFCKIKRAVLF